MIDTTYILYIYIHIYTYTIYIYILYIYIIEKNKEMGSRIIFKIWFNHLVDTRHDCLGKITSFAIGVYLFKVFFLVLLDVHKVSSLVKGCQKISEKKSLLLFSPDFTNAGLLLTWGCGNLVYNSILKICNICSYATSNYSLVNVIYKLSHIIPVWNLYWDNPWLNGVYRWQKECGRMSFSEILSGVQFITSYT